MAKKKKAKTKKRVHRRPAAHPAVSQAAAPAVAPAPVAASQPLPANRPGPAPALQAASVRAPDQAAGAQTARWSYVGSDVRRIGILATICVVFELVLWYLFTYTGLGTAAYGLVK